MAIGFPSTELTEALGCHGRPGALQGEERGRVVCQECKGRCFEESKRVRPQGGRGRGESEGDPVKLVWRQMRTEILRFERMGHPIQVSVPPYTTTSPMFAIVPAKFLS